MLRRRVLKTLPSGPLTRGPGGGIPLAGSAPPTARLCTALLWPQKTRAHKPQNPPHGLPGPPPPPLRPRKIAFFAWVNQWGKGIHRAFGPGGRGLATISYPWGDSEGSYPSEKVCAAPPMHPGLRRSCTNITYTGTPNYSAKPLRDFCRLFENRHPARLPLKKKFGVSPRWDSPKENHVYYHFN